MTPLEELRKANSELAQQNAKVRAILTNTIPFFKDLIEASKYDAHDPRHRMAMDRLKRPKI